MRTPAVVDCQAGWSLLQTVTPFRGMQSYIQKPNNMIASILTELYTILLFPTPAAYSKGHSLGGHNSCINLPTSVHKSGRILQGPNYRQPSD